MNDETFVSGGTTNESPFLVALLEDEDGINTASGIGHDIVAILDGDVSNPFVLNDYYQTKLDDYTNGNLRFPLRNLTPGLHTISFTAWDVYNNPVTSEIQFVVVGDEELKLTHVLNPASRHHCCCGAGIRSPSAHGWHFSPDAAAGRR